jgi:hypothetical protein
MAAFGILALAIVVAVLTVVLIGSAGRNAALFAAVIVGALMIAEYAVASAGLLHEWTRRPPPLIIAASIPILIALVTAFSRAGEQIARAAPFAAIIGLQAFRFPLELVMHHAATTGLMPVEMSYSGRNIDIITGILAIPLALAAVRAQAPRATIIAWNVIGTLTLINIVAVAIAATPVFAAFGPDHLNTWVADVPYVFLPTVLVPAAVFGHALTWRKLALEA